ncbi:acyltransferase [Clostridium sp.]|uniref:acyltransferase n=1 Tax=Clostridium sp. TaxID=1506 RepID=UPI0032165871
MITRNYNIDIIKAVAIISVILLHSLTTDVLYLTGSPYHIWQTVPLFMLLAGYNSANSYARRQYESLNQFYDVSFLYKKLERLIYPFLLVWLMQVVAQFLIADGLSFKELIYSLVTGGWGPGSYFVPIIIQVTLILPAIYLLCKKKSTAMTIVLFVISLLLEVFCLLIDIPEGLYRLLALRYLFAVTLGVWLSLNSKKLKYKWLIPLAIISLIYITGVNYFEWSFIMEYTWQSQHAPSYFWTLLLAIIGLKVYQVKSVNIISKLSVKIGQASYHIFLVQMAYFWAVAEMLPNMPVIVFSVINVVICLFLGLTFFEFENWVRKTIKKRSENKNAVQSTHIVN